MKKMTKKFFLILFVTLCLFSTSCNKKDKKTNLNDAVISIDKVEYPYTGNAIIPVFTVKLENIELVKDNDYSFEIKDNIDIGKGIITITGKGKYVGSIDKKFDIVKATLSGISSSKITTTYDSTKEVSPVITGIVDGDKVSYKINETDNYVDTLPKFKNVGTYKVFYKVEREKFNDFESSVDIVINKATMDVTSTGVDVLFDNTEKSISVVGNNDDADLEYLYRERGTTEWSNTIPKYINVVTKTIEFKVVDKNGNYEDFIGSEEVKISNNNLQLDKNTNYNDITKEYDGISITSIGLTNHNYGSLNVEYKVDDAEEYSETLDLKNVGTYEVKLLVSKENYNKKELFIIVKIIAKDFNFITEPFITTEKDSFEYLDLLSSLTINGAKILIDGEEKSDSEYGVWEWNFNTTDYLNVVGEFDCSIKFIPNDKNYNEVLKTISINVQSKKFTKDELNLNVPTLPHLEGFDLSNYIDTISSSKSNIGISRFVENQFSTIGESNYIVIFIVNAEFRDFYEDVYYSIEVEFLQPEEIHILDHYFHEYHGSKLDEENTTFMINYIGNSISYFTTISLGVGANIKYTNAYNQEIDYIDINGKVYLNLSGVDYLLNIDIQSNINFDSFELNYQGTNYYSEYLIDEISIEDFNYNKNNSINNLGFLKIDDIINFSIEHSDNYRLEVAFKLEFYNNEIEEFYLSNGFLNLFYYDIILNPPIYLTNISYVTDDDEISFNINERTFVLPSLNDLIKLNLSFNDELYDVYILTKNNKVKANNGVNNIVKEVDLYDFYVLIYNVNDVEDGKEIDDYKFEIVNYFGIESIKYEKYNDTIESINVDLFSDQVFLYIIDGDILYFSLSVEEGFIKNFVLEMSAGYSYELYKDNQVFNGINFDYGYNYINAKIFKNEIEIASINISVETTLNSLTDNLKLNDEHSIIFDPVGNYLYSDILEIIDFLEISCTCENFQIALLDNDYNPYTDLYNLKKGINYFFINVKKNIDGKDLEINIPYLINIPYQEINDIIIANNIKVSYNVNYNVEMTYNKYKNIFETYNPLFWRTHDINTMLELVVVDINNIEDYDIIKTAGLTTINIKIYKKSDDTLLVEFDVFFKYYDLDLDDNVDIEYEIYDIFDFKEGKIKDEEIYELFQNNAFYISLSNPNANMVLNYNDEELNFENNIIYFLKTGTYNFSITVTSTNKEKTITYNIQFFVKENPDYFEIRFDEANKLVLKSNFTNNDFGDFELIYFPEQENQPILIKGEVNRSLVVDNKLEIESIIKIEYISQIKINGNVIVELDNIICDVIDDKVNIELEIKNNEEIQGIMLIELIVV